jgi:hypothetical protein
MVCLIKVMINKGLNMERSFGCMESGVNVIRSLLLGAVEYQTFVLSHDSPLIPFLS